MLRLADARASVEHTFVDLGADEFTEGRPHPMIDASQRSARIRAEGRDPQVAVLLLDVILGYGAAEDPAGDLIEAIRDAKGEAERRGGHLAVLASVCGTEGDLQGLEKQEAALRDVGVILFPSNAQAALAARELVSRIDER
jgi:FdrA protein